MIGVGSFGTAIAWHKLTGRKVAIKPRERSKMKDPQQWKRVQQEAQSDGEPVGLYLDL